MYCVYLIFYKGNKLPSFYIGSSSLEKLENGYRGSVVSKKYKDIFLSETKNNIDLFNYIILEKCENREVALKYELAYQKLFNVVKSPYFFNMSFASIDGMFGRDVSGINNPMYGKNHSSDTKAILSEKRGNEKRYDITSEHKKIISKTHKGKVLSSDTKKKISDKIKGTIVVIDKNGNCFRTSINDEKYLNGEYTTPTTDKVVVKNLNGKTFMVDRKDERYLNGELVSINKGRVVSDETKKKLSEINKGRIVSDETKEKISNSKKGVSRGEFSEEWKKRISDSLKGRTFKEESIEKLIKSKTGMKYKESICPYCGKKGRGGNMKRYHFDNCKNKD